MTILALSTSSHICSVALLENDSVIKELDIDSDRSHSENLMPLIKEILNLCNIKLSDIALIACDNGPRLFHRNQNWNGNC